MTNYGPYKIVHCQLSETAALLAPAESTYFVFWDAKIPLAHLWWNHLNDSSAFQASVKKALPSGVYQVPAYQSGKISVVICTRNRPLAIRQCLQSLMICTDQDFELIVIDNAPDDTQTHDVVAGFPGVKYVLETRKGLDIARNTGARYASHDIIAYTDDDVLIPPDWITNLKCCFNDPLTMAVTGLVIPHELRTEAQITFERDWGFNKGYVPKVFDHKYFLEHLPYGVPAWDVGAGANMAFRKQAFQLAGWFDERLDVGASGCSGDSEMWYRVMAEGWTCHYFPHLYVYHQHRESMKELTKQLFSYMRGHTSALLVQYENYKHNGNLTRLYNKLPKYYYYRVKNYLLKQGDRNNRTLFSEIKGCISGWKFYKANKHRKRHDIFEFPESLKTHVPAGNQALVSVVIPCYNHAHYLHQAIESVLTQTHKNVEIIVVDDGSEDNTPSVCSSYGELVKYVRVERVGLSAARNAGVQFATGKFIMFLDADDYLYPRALERNLFYFNYYKNVVFVSGGHNRVDEKGTMLPGPDNKVRWGDNYVALLQGNYIAMEATVLYRRDLFFHYHFDTSLPSCEDYDLNLQIARSFPVFTHADVVAAYRIHSNNMSRNTGVMLSSALTVLNRQQKGLMNDEERKAWQEGLENWKSFYSK